jgi:glycosyltransferase involved in cell wall biosynthesis
VITAPASAQPTISFVTTCMGRLRHLQQTLPLLAGQPNTVCVVVDYSCPDHCGDWIAANCPGVKVVHWQGATRFNPAHARNLGVAGTDTDVLCLIDADVLISLDFVPALLSRFDTGAYYLADPLTEDLVGTVCCTRAAFDAIGGYDEVCSGWGGEDLDLYDRLDLHGLHRAHFDASLVSAIHHSDAERTAFHSISDKLISNGINQIYSHIKLDMMRLGRKEFSLDFRRALHAKISEACLSGRAARIELTVANYKINNFTIKNNVGYAIDVKKR